MSFVFVLDQEKRPLDPIHPGRARYLLQAGHAAVYRLYPFTLIMKEAKSDATPAPLRIKIDPGSKTTGLAVVNDATGQVVWAAAVTHHGQEIREKLARCSAQRHGRRARHTRYRLARFLNRTRPKGWLPPSLVSRLQNVVTWVQRLQRLAPIAAISYELVRFDTQLMQDAEVTGVQYQQGELAGYEVREYLLEKWHRCCAYCGEKGVPLQIEHIVPKARGGTNRVSNLTLACAPCNVRKGTKTAEESGYPAIQQQANQYGFPRTRRKGPSVVQGFRSGDMAKAIITTGTKIGTYVGRVAIRETGSFNITTTSGTIQGLNVKYCTMIQRTDGYTYQHYIQKARSA